MIRPRYLKDVLCLEKVSVSDMSRCQVTGTTPKISGLLAVLSDLL
jgi:hypothetical protein